MTNPLSKTTIDQLFTCDPQFESNFYDASAGAALEDNQSQTNDVFSEKWTQFNEEEQKSQEKLFEFQRNWYLELYGFNSEEDLKTYLNGCQVVLDAGCGLGYKAAWFAELAPQTTVIGIDFSDAARHAALNYSHLPNLYFVKGDIANTQIRTGAIDYVSCDQVIMHTESPEETFAELARITAPHRGEFACYFYAKKALPRELLDDHFREKCKTLSNDQLWELARALTELGKTLSELDLAIEVPDLPALGISGGEYDLQRFIYWNFIKCFWNEELGYATSLSTNFDWYAPSNARRFSEEEIIRLSESNSMVIKKWHHEPACYSGRFAHRI